jgi:ABC-type antimicrobial peptide transport system permease subunit
VSVGAPGAGQVPIDLVASMSAPQNEIAAAYNAMSPGFFQLLGIRVEEGRDFTWNDREHAPRVAIVSRGLARRLFPNGEVLGQSLRIGVLPHRQNLQVIGVVADARLYDIKDSNAYAVYMPYLQDAQGFGLTLLVRGTNISFKEVSRVVASLGHHYLVTTESLEQVKERALMQQRVTALLAEFFGGLALLLAGIGIYGLIAYDVTERTKELGIRLALGARPQRMISEIVAHAVRIAGIGIAAGLAVSLLTAQLVRSLLFGITDRDVVTLSAVPLLLLGVAIVAPSYQQRRLLASTPS